MDEEVASIRRYDPDMTPEREAAYRKACGKTLHAAQLKLADDFDALSRACHVEEIGDRIYAHLRAISDDARDRGLREFFRRFW
jgi:hypothetical protein